MKRVVPSRLYGDLAGQLAFLTRGSADPEACWEFAGYVNPRGYGQLGRNKGAHRIAWEVAHGGPVPDGLVIDHQCHNLDPDCNDDSACLHRRCVNPAHLEAVIQRTNLVRGKGFGGRNARVTHCPQGHEFTEANTYYRPDRFGRICRACRDEALRKLRPYYAAKRAAKARAARESRQERAA